MAQRGHGTQAQAGRSPGACTCYHFPVSQGNEVGGRRKVRHQAAAGSNMQKPQDWSLFEMKQDDVTSHKAGPVPPDFLKKLSPECPGAVSSSPEGEFSKCVPFLLALVLKKQK